MQPAREPVEQFEPDEELVRMTAELRRAIESGESVPFISPEDVHAYMERDRLRHR